MTLLCVFFFLANKLYQKCKVQKKKINDLEEDLGEENVLFVDKDDINLLTDNPSLIQPSFITTQAETKTTTIKPFNLKKEDNSMKMNMKEQF